MLKCFQPRNVCFACRGIVLLSASVSCPDGKIVAKPTLLPLLRWVLDEKTFEEAEYLLVCAVANEISDGSPHFLRKGRIVLSALPRAHVSFHLGWGCPVLPPAIYTRTDFTVTHTHTSSLLAIVQTTLRRHGEPPVCFIRLPLALARPGDLRSTPDLDMKFPRAGTHARPSARLLHGHCERSAHRLAAEASPAVLVTHLPLPWLVL